MGGRRPAATTQSMDATALGKLEGTGRYSWTTQDATLIKIDRSYAVERPKPCSSAIHRRRTQLPTPDESGNYSGGTIKDPVGNNDRCSLLTQFLLPFCAFFFYKSRRLGTNKQ